MTVSWTVFNETTGEILRTGFSLTEAQAALQAFAGEKVTFVNSDPVTEVVQNPGSAEPTIVTKPNNSIAANKTSFLANGVDYVSISPIVAGSKVTILVPESQGISVIAPFVVNDGVLEITTTVAGAYSVTVTDFPKQDYVVTLNAT